MEKTEKTDHDSGPRNRDCRCRVAGHEREGVKSGPITYHDPGLERALALLLGWAALFHRAIRWSGGTPKQTNRFTYYGLNKGFKILWTRDCRMDCEPLIWISEDGSKVSQPVIGKTLRMKRER